MTPHEDSEQASTCTESIVRERYRPKPRPDITGMKGYQFNIDAPILPPPPPVLNTKRAQSPSEPLINLSPNESIGSVHDSGILETVPGQTVLKCGEMPPQQTVVPDFSSNIVLAQVQVHMVDTQ
jgi:hypothetical protein